MLDILEQLGVEFLLPLECQLFVNEIHRTVFFPQNVWNQTKVQMLVTYQVVIAPEILRWLVQQLFDGGSMQSQLFLCVGVEFLKMGFMHLEVQGVTDVLTAGLLQGQSLDLGFFQSLLSRIFSPLYEFCVLLALVIAVSIVTEFYLDSSGILAAGSLLSLQIRVMKSVVEYSHAFACEFLNVSQVFMF